MARLIFAPRKQRTWQHVIADLSVHYVEGFILEEGHTVQRMQLDYGYDLMMNTFDPEGYAEPGPVYFQLKAMESLQMVSSAYVFDLDIRDYHLWMSEEIPVILVLFDAARRKAYWLWVQNYFDQPTTARPKPEAKTVRVRISQRQSMNRRAIRQIRKFKTIKQSPRLGVIS